MSRRAAHLRQDLLKQAQGSWAVAVLIGQPGLLQLVIYLWRCRVSALYACQLQVSQACSSNLQSCSAQGYDFSEQQLDPLIKHQ